MVVLGREQGKQPTSSERCIGGNAGRAVEKGATTQVLVAVKIVDDGENRRNAEREGGCKGVKLAEDRAKRKGGWQQAREASKQCFCVK